MGKIIINCTQCKNNCSDLRYINGRISELDGKIYDLYDEIGWGNHSRLRRADAIIGYNKTLEATANHIEYIVNEFVRVENCLTVTNFNEIKQGRLVRIVNENIKSTLDNIEEAIETVSGVAKTTAGIVGGGTIGVAAIVNKVAGNAYDKIVNGSKPEIVAIDGSINTNVTEKVESNISASGATIYKLPDYALQGLYPDENGIWGPYVFHSDGSTGRVAEFNYGGELSCTYYTLRKLNQQGLSYPCWGGPGNGSQWYKHYDPNAELPNYAGNSALYDLVSNLKLPQENVVVSFEKNPAWDEYGNMYYQDYGHVLLIDKIYEENGQIWVQYSDNYNTDTKQYVGKDGNLNATNAPQWKTLDAFMAHYNKYNGNISGAVVIGAGNGTNIYA